MQTHELKFVNSDARPKTQIVHLDAPAIQHVMAWYASHFAFDRYAVYVDGVKVKKDLNGLPSSEVRP